MRSFWEDDVLFPFLFLGSYLCDLKGLTPPGWNQVAYQILSF